MNNIYNITLNELEEFFINNGEKKFKAQQVFEWLYRMRIKTFDEMTNLSKKQIELLKEHFEIKELTLKEKYMSKDGTVKFLFSLDDGNLIESVLMKHPYGNSVCITSEVGCKMGCIFCASGELGFVRKLTLAEMVLQVLMVDNYLKETNDHLSNIVVMGIGEPFDNYETLIKFLYLVNYPKGLEIGARHITVSTSGIVPKIREFAEIDLQINLAISLHAPNNELRNKLMKINKTYPIEEVIDAVKYYLTKTNRRITFEYILIKGINDSMECAKELVKLLRGINCYVNLIPYNKVWTKDLDTTDHLSAEAFLSYLIQKGITTTLRIEKGSDVNAACGQLRAKRMVNNES